MGKTRFFPSSSSLISSFLTWCNPLFIVRVSSPFFLFPSSLHFDSGCLRYCTWATCWAPYDGEHWFCVCPLLRSWMSNVMVVARDYAESIDWLRVNVRSTTQRCELKCHSTILGPKPLLGNIPNIWVYSGVAFSSLYPLSSLMIGRSVRDDLSET